MNLIRQYRSVLICFTLMLITIFLSRYVYLFYQDNYHAQLEKELSLTKQLLREYQGVLYKQQGVKASKELFTPCQSSELSRLDDLLSSLDKLSQIEIVNEEMTELQILFSKCAYQPVFQYQVTSIFFNKKLAEFERLVDLFVSSRLYDDKKYKKLLSYWGAVGPLQEKRGVLWRELLDVQKYMISELKGGSLAEDRVMNEARDTANKLRGELMNSRHELKRLYDDFPLSESKT